MSLGTTDIPPTLREKSTWTPKHNKIANQKVNIFIVSVDWLLLFFFTGYTIILLHRFFRKDWI